jgi:hypothetical protein
MMFLIAASSLPPDVGFADIVISPWHRLPMVED